MKSYILWENGAPLFDPSLEQDQPSLDAYILPGSKTRAAVIVCPGGGYCFRAEDHEGVQICEYFNSLGINAFMLKYRVAPYTYPAELYDIQRAVRFVRHNAESFNVDPEKIGVMGFSAGGHLTVMGIEQYDGGLDSGDGIDRTSCRPNFGILCYAVCTLDQPYSHHGSAYNLLGEEAYNNDKDLLARLSGENSVPDDCPPVFIWHTGEDDCVPVMNALAMAEALSEKKIPYELHIFPKGSHGIGLAKGMEGAERWPEQLAGWLSDNGWRA